MPKWKDLMNYNLLTLIFEVICHFNRSNTEVELTGSQDDSILKL